MWIGRFTPKVVISLLLLLTVVTTAATHASAYCLICIDACNCGLVEGGGGTHCTVQIYGGGCRCMVSGFDCTGGGGPRPIPTGFELAPGIPEEQSGVIAAVSTALIALPAGVGSPVPASRAWHTVALADPSDLVGATISELASSTGAPSTGFTYVGGLAMMQRFSGRVVHRTPTNDGYAIRVLPDAAGARILVKIMQSGVPSGSIVDVVLANADNALLVPLALEGRRCILAIQALVLQAPEAHGALARQNDARVLSLHQVHLDSGRRFRGPSDAAGQAMVVVQ